MFIKICYRDKRICSCSITNKEERKRDGIGSTNTMNYCLQLMVDMATEELSKAGDIGMQKLLSMLLKLH